mgnify:CR=1 FL=1
MIDEADEMFDMGFLPDIRKIIGQLPTERQTMLFSATMPPEIRQLAKGILLNPVNVQVGESAPVPTVSHAIYPVGQHLKAPLLMKLIDRMEMDSVLVFTRTKSRATRLAMAMCAIDNLVAALAGQRPPNLLNPAVLGT